MSTSNIRLISFPYFNEPISISKDVNPVSLKQISECSSVPVKDLKFYNPELKQSLIPPLKENEVYKTCLKHLNDNSQIFVVCPFIEESEKLDIKAAENVYKQYKEKFQKYLQENKLSSHMRVAVKK